MTNPLRNKAVVSCLAVIAALGLAANVLKFPSRLRVAAAAAIPEPGGTEEKFETSPVLAIRDELLSWASSSPTASARDPFAWPHSAVPIPTNAPAGPAPAFRLQGVSIEGEKMLAVVNQRVVGTGDKLGDYVVERILPREVWMHGPAGRITVRLAR